MSVPFDGASSDCTATRTRLESWALDSLEPAESRRVERHLAGCGACRGEAAEVRDLLSALPRALEPCLPPPEVLLELLQRVRSSRERRRLGSLGIGAAAAAALFATVLLLRPLEATSLARALQSPDVAVISLFAAIDSPITSVYEYQTEARVEFDRSIGRILFNVRTGEWKLVVHGLPRPPRGARYVLSGVVDGTDLPLGTIERWEDGVAVLAGRAEQDLTRTERISLELVSPHSRWRLLDSVDGAW
jgi:hypothetical protein